MAHIAHPSFFHLITHFRTHPPCLALSSPVAAVGKSACAITRRKHGLIAASKQLVAKGMTLQKAVVELRVSHSNLVKWTAKGIGNIDSLDKILKPQKKLTTNPLEDALLHYIFELHDQGVTVNTFIVMLRASFLLPEFHAKSFTARCSAMKRFFHCPFVHLSNGHTHVAARAGRS